MLRRLCFHALLALLLWGVAGRGAAQERPPHDEAEARRLYALGKVEYAQGRFGEAIALFERSYALTGAPALLFNLAQAHRLLGPDHCPQASALYRSYLSALPAAENRREVEERIQQLAPCASRPTPVAEADPSAAPEENAREPYVAPPAATALPPARDGGTRRLGPWLVGVSGVVLLAAGGALYGKAYAEHADAERECPCYPGTFTKWERLTKLSYVTLAAGGAALAGGIAWFTVGVRAGSSQAGLVISGRF